MLWNIFFEIVEVNLIYDTNWSTNNLLEIWSLKVMDYMIISDVINYSKP